LRLGAGYGWREFARTHRAENPHPKIASGVLNRASPVRHAAGNKQEAISPAGPLFRSLHTCAGFPLAVSFQ